MNKKIITYALSLILLLIVKAHRINPQRPQDNSLLITRCRSMCSIETAQNHDMMNCDVDACVQNSIILVKYGNCPVTQNNNNKLDSLCIDVCNEQDYKCPHIQKCCSHECGKSCREPDNLEKNDDLPPIPYNITLTETELQNVDIKFDLTNRKKHNRPILYVLEARAHIGKFFREYKLGDWKWITFQHRYDTPFKHNDTYSTRTVGQIKLRPGRWYQFRVAAVNENGTKGYSDISKEFQLKESPNIPKKPKFLRINQIFLKNSTYHVNIKWSSPKSDLPIEKYKISWSLFLKSKGKNHSLWMEHAYVFEPQRSYEITKLLPNSSYYIQVQSIAVYGRKRFISDKKSKIVNTTNHDITSFHLNKNRIDETEVIDVSPKTLSINFLPDTQSRFFVRIAWKKYFDREKTILELCKGNESCFTRKSSEDFKSVLVKDNTYDFINLRFNSFYTARLKQFGKNKYNVKSEMKHFLTPSCESFKRKYSYLKFAC